MGSDQTPEWKAAEQRRAGRKLADQIHFGSSGIRDITEGPIVRSLLAVFRQMETMGCKSDAEG